MRERPLLLLNTAHGLQDDEDIAGLVYVDRPEWAATTSPTDWEYYVSREVREPWATFTYERKWHIAQNASSIACEVHAHLAAEMGRS